MATATSAASHAQTLDVAHRHLLTNSALQFHFSEAKPPPPPPAWLKALGEFLQAFAPFLNVLFWIGVAGIVGGILYFLVREIMRRLPATASEKSNVPPPPRPEFRPNKARAQVLLEEADRLAREGRFEEAVRVLLHRSINDIEDTFPNAVGPSLTAREIGRLEQLSARGREVFAHIARSVEKSLFGIHKVDAAEFAECRRIYSDFVFGAGPA